ncbi:outer membrane beta-barrel family protein [Pedobacter duraquae]|uniref:Outer membrane receptor protein involved in Fe transport n=1 Tax=Pedobacter duraquae TaxID=425511 RepID=A0A4R6IPS6_9SPHI|nr:outer membrane beta-barrel family protein [Pedobacter duraquae]TDO24273.1 outer membrane receptor protein involved in Fe transport [Pedobacter duraquae]
MNNICKLLCALMALFFMPIIAMAQDLSGSVKGIVSDSLSSKPAEYITLAIKKDGNVVKTVLTTQNGGFTFAEIPFGKYTLTATATGYTPKVVPFELTAEKNSFDAGNILLADQVNALADVAVVAIRPIIKQEVDRISYDIQADPESKVLTALDMMRKVPLLSLDADDNIKLKGSDNYRILINGKPSAMLDRNPKDVLRGMPASSIQKIEVITTPPAKYDSEGLSGIINIITNKKIDNGYNGSINLRHQFPVGGPNGSANIAYKQGKFGITAYGGTGKYAAPETEIVTSRSTTGVNPSELLNIGKRKSNNIFRYGGADLSFELDTLNLFTAGINPYNGLYDATNNQTFSLRTPSQLSSYHLLGRNRFDWDGLELSLNYQHGFKSNKDRLLTFSFKSNSGSNPQKNELIFTERQNYTDPNYLQQNDSRQKEQTMQLDYVHPVNKLNIEGGIKAILRDNSSNFEYQTFNSQNGQYVTDPTRTNMFNNKQNIIAAYNTYAYSLTNVVFKAGVRIEETFVKADFISNSSNVNTDYFNIIPSFSINRKFANQSNVNFGFTQRIQRPGIYNMNPFVDRSTPNFESTGNPDLKAVLANNFELTYSKFKKGSVNVGLSYNFANNTIQNVSVYNPVTGITRTSFANIGRDKSLTTNLNINYPLTAKWNVSVSGNIGYTWLEGTINGVVTQNEGIKGYGYINTGYKFEKQWKANASFSYNAPYVTLQGKSGEYVFMSFSGSKEIIKDKLTVSAGIYNPFSKYRLYESFTEGPNFRQQYKGQNYNRSFTLGLNWKFGGLKDEIKKNKRSITNDDVKGGSTTGK